jgi:hypothetical protein
MSRKYKLSEREKKNRRFDFMRNIRNRRREKNE